MRPELERRTEKPTASRRQKARDAGKVASSRDLVAASSLLVVLLGARQIGPSALARANDGIRDLLGELSRAEELTIEASAEIVSGAIGIVGAVLGPLALMVVVSVVVATFAQSGWLFRPVAVAPDLARLGGDAGWRHVLSVRSAGRGVFALAKCVWIASTLWYGLTTLLDGRHEVSVRALLGQPLAGAAWLASEHVLDIATITAAGFTALGIADWVFQRWRLESELRMTREELLEELADQEVPASTRRRRRRLARRLTVATTRTGGGGPR